MLKFSLFLVSYLFLISCGSSENSSLYSLDKGFNHDEIAAEVPIIDLHADTVLYLSSNSPSSIMSSNLEAGYPNMKKGKYGAQFYVAWIAPDQRKVAYKRANNLLDTLDKVVKGNPNQMSVVSDTTQLNQQFSAGKISAFYGIEGGEAIESSLDNINHFYKRGVRYMTLTWNSYNLIADAAADAEKPHGGLSPYGEQVVKRMNDLGMVVDVSHTSNDTVEDVLRVSKDPIIASHSCSYALRNHSRNLNDTLIKGICSRGGVIGLNYNTGFLTSSGSSTVKTLGDHFDKIIAVGGIDCLALGSDFDGSIDPPSDFKNAGQIENLTKELIKRGYTKEQIEKIYSKNIQRLISKVVKK